MPYTLTPMNKGARKTRLAVEDVPEDVTVAVLEAFEYCQAHPDKWLSIQFQPDGDTTAGQAAEDFLHAARSYAYAAEPRLVVEGYAIKSGFARFTVSLWGAQNGTKPAETPATM